MAITQNYVDYGAGNDTTGDGTIGTPWKTLQKAFNTLTRNTTDGNQVNLKAGTAHVNAAALDLTTFVGGGALSATAPLIIRGYTSAANDGGIGEIDASGATLFSATTHAYIHLVDLEIHTFGDNHGVQLGNYCVVHHCEVHKGASSPAGKYLISMPDGSGYVTGCHIHDAGTGACRGISGPALAYGNYVVLPAGADGRGIVIGFDGAGINNIILIGTASNIGLSTGSYGSAIGNVIYNTAAGTGHGIFSTSSRAIINNIVVGFSGVGGYAIGNTNAWLWGWNAFYNNTTNLSLSDMDFFSVSANDVSLAADPFTDAANGDFSLTVAAKAALADAGWPTSYLGAHANTVPNLNIGPIQIAAGGGSSIFRRVARLLGG